MRRISGEVAEASRAADTKVRFTSAKYTDVLVQTAKELERKQAFRRSMRKQLKRTDADIRRLKRELRTLAQQIGSGKDE